jgi:1,4-dihydroxy-6-naphthoate synthase
MKLSIGFSPCPNDPFIFDALVNGKIDTGKFTFDPVLEDVQTLNNRALQENLDITKLSYGVLPLVLDKYILLNSGSALGTGVGPLLIKNSKTKNNNVDEELVAIPGENTTAHLLFSMAYPDTKNKIFIRYDEIENFVLNGKGFGVIIHENRFTYQNKGLEKIVDLGEFWERQTNHFIPLGGIVIKRHLDSKTQQEIDLLIRKSIEYAYANNAVISDFIKLNSQEMSEDVMRKHIDLYVNNYSLDLGETGRNAVKKLLEVYQQINNNKIDYNSIFVKQ